MVRQEQLVIISSAQYGYNSDSYFFAKLLAKTYHVTYLGYDHGFAPFDSGEVNVVHISFNLGKLKSRIELFRKLKELDTTHKYKYALIFYFTFSAFIKFYLSRQVISIMDIRTSFIFLSSIKRSVYNGIMKIELAFFKNRTIISKSLQEFLKIQEAHILPLGAPIVNSRIKDFKTISLIYVGTFFDRKIETTIAGFSYFMEKYGFPKDIKYDIVGFGSKEDIDILKNAIASHKLDNSVQLIGEVRYPLLQQYLDKANVGVSYIPKTNYYDCQPPTKTFEYLLNGMAVIATNTNENCAVIDESNGVIIYDTPDAFSDGIEIIYQARARFKSDAIKKSAEKYSWENIVNSNLIPFLKSLSK